MASIGNKSTIRLSKSCLSDAEKQAVMDVLDREFLGMGREVQQFEEALTEFFGRPAVCVSTGTAALHLALQAAGIGHGDEVLVQSLTYVASFQSISATGATPIACDIDPDTLTLDWRDAEKRLTDNTKAVMPVHYGGGVGALDEIYAFAEKYNLRVVEDAAHAFGSLYNGNKVGGSGDIACFSFDGIKNITSGEGGCIVTDDPVILQKVRDARLLGVENDTEKRYSNQRSWDFDVTAQGWRYHMSNIMAAIGLVQFNRFEELANKRRTLATIYDEQLESVTEIAPIKHDYGQVVPHIYVVKLAATVDRDNVRMVFGEQGVQTAVHYQPNHKLSYYYSDDVEISSVDTIYPRLLTLPIHPNMSRLDVMRVCGLLKDTI